MGGWLLSSRTIIGPTYITPRSLRDISVPPSRARFGAESCASNDEKRLRVANVAMPMSEGLAEGVMRTGGRFGMECA